jgi:hypothetical protein
MTQRKIEVIILGQRLSIFYLMDKMDDLVQHHSVEEV